MLGLNSWQLFLCAAETCVLWWPLCYQSQCDGAEHRSDPSALLGMGFAGTQAERQLWSP